jgi:Na+/H+-dicarboxylate symporter/ABC-type amino acid transport substrate-binding protein
MTFTRKILLGLVGGTLTGLFLGELATPVGVVGDIFINLLQMTVLPYIVVSLVGNLGRISWSESRRLIIAACTILALLLGLGVVILALVPLAFPAWHSASFFSPSLLEEAHKLDLVALYIPSNPFASLSQNIVPAVVIFSILLGIGISGIPGNKGLLDAMEVTATALNRINKLIIKLTPIGVFGIAAGTAGTISIGEMSRLQAYLLTYTVIVIILSMVVLPLLITAVTPFRYRDLLSIPKDTMITIFATAKIVVLLPQLVDSVKELFNRYQLEDDECDTAAEVLLPLAYPFPNLGTYIVLMFVPFSAWYLGRAMEWQDLITFQAAALLSSFVAPIIGIPFLLDIARIPADMMELFVMSTIYTDRLRVVLGAAHLLTLTVIAISINRGIFKVNWPRLTKVCLLSAVLIGASLYGVRAYLTHALADSYAGDTALLHMHWMNRPVPAKQYIDTLPPPDPTASTLGRSRAVIERGSLRVAYLDDAVPFVFHSDDGQLVGFEVEMAHNLALNLEVELELIHIDLEQLDALFASGQVDIVMSGLAITPGRARQWLFTASPLDLTLGLLVPDHRRKSFTNRDALRRFKNLQLGAVQADRIFSQEIERALPNASVHHVASAREFLDGERPELDALIYSAEGGSAWTLLYPDYTVVIPNGGGIKIPLGYPVPADDLVWERYISQWIELKQKDGTVEALYNHWILGGGAMSSEPRWSIVRDVLHWID